MLFCGSCNASTTLLQHSTPPEHAPLTHLRRLMSPVHTFRICFSAVLPTLLARSHDAPCNQGTLLQRSSDTSMAPHLKRSLYTSETIHIISSTTAEHSSDTSLIFQRHIDASGSPNPWRLRCGNGCYTLPHASPMLQRRTGVFKSPNPWRLQHRRG